MKRGDESSGEQSSSGSTNQQGGGGAAVDSASQVPQPSFFRDAKDLPRVACNPFGRYDQDNPPPAKQAYILIEESGGTKRWTQFDTLNTLDSSRFRAISGVTWQADIGLFRADSPGGTFYQGDPQRALQMGSCQAVPLSPVRGRTKFAVVQLHQNPESVNKGVSVKAQSIVVTAAAIRRARNKGSKGHSTKKVMGHTARAEYLSYARDNKENLTEHGSQFFTSVAADCEWLHAVARSLLPDLRKAQHASNLGAALANENTRMMIMEKFAREFARYPGMKVTITPTFYMLPHSEIIHNIDYSLEVAYTPSPPDRARTLLIHQRSDALELKESPRSTDKLMISLAFDLLVGKAPVRGGPVMLVQHSSGVVSSHADAVNALTVAVDELKPYEGAGPDPMARM